MKNALEMNNKKAPVVRIDKSLNQYDDVVLFPDKVAKAKKAFERFGAPNLKKVKSPKG